MTNAVGHSSVIMTLDKYSHVMLDLGGDDVMEDALSRANAVLLCCHQDLQQFNTTRP